jgi:hypothetical protein
MGKLPNFMPQTKKYDFKTKADNGVVTYGYKLANGLVKEVSYKKGKIVSVSKSKDNKLVDRKIIRSNKTFSKVNKTIVMKNNSIGKLTSNEKLAIQRYVDYLCHENGYYPEEDAYDIKCLKSDVIDDYMSDSAFRTFVLDF